ncbi:MFS transporter [Thermoflexus sp.]|uniref:MFS transporter n=1 Tax=Thermoflexus sp. TaxID=1969742 RepID=UPI0025FAD8AC|nr:MFS transporter [Thermoflexus sp.]MDW8065880.1 MFS transporter [Anaerolineae bacterium]MCS6963572.1 MFS transporter [Thermoflexus sp.]MCS7350893.1 MFS transporter [Thermoflexus sp.]MCX7690038.1 MFS transporter [Thermoflexus sp.]MDW8180344.1 MFS transporter [Anaerolineae bacterium]
MRGSRLSGRALWPFGRSFTLLWAGQFLSQVGDQFLFIAGLSLLDRLTDSRAAFGGLALAITLPQILFGLWGGVFADRWPRRYVLIGSDLARALIVLGALTVQTNADLWRMYPLASALAIAGLFFYPARNAVLPALVPPAHLLQANTMLQASYILALVAGGISAGVFVDAFGPYAAFVFDSVTFLVSALTLAWIHLPESADRPQPAQRNSPGHDLLEGLRFVWTHRSLRGVTAITPFATVGIGVVQVLGLAFLAEVLQVRAGGFGLTLAMMGIGLALGLGIVPLLGRRIPIHLVVGLFLAAAGLSTVAFSQAQTFAFVLLAAFAMGLCVVVARAGLATLIQEMTPNPLRGRVDSLVNLMVNGALALAQGGAGLFGQLWGPRPVLMGAGLLMVLVGGFAALGLRGLRVLPSEGTAPAISGPEKGGLLPPPRPPHPR